MKCKLLMLFVLCTSALFGGQNEWTAYKKSIIPRQKTFQGWCSEEKVNKMMDLIYDTKPLLCVEIGVFGGSSVYPTAAALKYNNEGTIYAIDPWSNAECLKGYHPEDPNYKWWSSINLEKILADFKGKMGRYGVNTYCNILRMTSNDALSRFEDNSIDILHIDGNHTEEIALNDILMYFPKVKSGGYIWFDDANWSTTARAIDFLLETCDTFDENRSTETCLLFRKP